MKNKLKMYIELPFMAEWRNFLPIKSIPIGAGFNIDWNEYGFSHCGGKEYFPHNPCAGKSKFTITFGLFYWSIKIVFYKPI
jgi:hypothetical protein